MPITALGYAQPKTAKHLLDAITAHVVSMPITALGYAQPSCLSPRATSASHVSMPITALGYAQQHLLEIQ